MISKGGVLVDKHLRQALGSYIKSSNGFNKLQIQPASLDLTLSDKGWRIAGSFLPSGPNVLDEVDVYEELDLSKSVLIEPNIPYMFRLSEVLNLPKGFHGKTNPKSSIGRAGLLVRVVVAGRAPSFDVIPDGYKGELYVQVISTSFPIILRKGLALTQLRLYDGMYFGLDDSDLKIAFGKEPLIYVEGKPVPVDEVDVRDGIVLSINLKNYDIAGFRAKKRTPPLDLTKIYYHDPLKYFEPIPRTNRVIISKDDFLILSALEAIKVTPGFAAELKPFGHGYGDLRAHYAGFFDPGWGYGRYKVGRQTKFVAGAEPTLEVMSMESSLMLRHGQPICTIGYERCKDFPERIYGATGSHYHVQNRGPTLSKYFKVIPFKEMLRLV